MTRDDIIRMARQLWCALKGHGGIAQIGVSTAWRCKRCGKVVQI
jgi:hypothetical protein